MINLRAVISSLVLSTILFMGLSFVCIYISWGWLSPIGWPSLETSTPYLLSALGLIIPLVSAENWHIYVQFLNQNHFVDDFYLHLSLPPICAALISLIVGFLIYRSLSQSNGLIHVNGPKLRFGKAARVHAAKMHRKDLKAAPEISDGIKIHPEIKISMQREQQNFGIFGTTGSGKSTVFKPVVHQVTDRGDRAIIYDEKGEYTQEFYSADSTVLLAPWDARSAMWDISLDVKSKNDAELLAQCIIPDDNSDSPMWVNGARAILVGLILSILDKGKPWGWSDLYQRLSLPLDDAIDLLQRHHPIATGLVQKDSKTTQGYYSHLITNLGWLEDIAKAWPSNSKELSRFSVNQWVNNSSKQKKTIIIQSHSKFSAIGAPLCNTVIALLSQHFLAKKDAKQLPTWLFIDEFANLPPNEHVKKWLEKARAYGARSVICTQSISQLNDIYGHEEAKSILNQLSNMVVLRMGAGGDDAKQVAHMFGEREVEVPNYENRQHIGRRFKQSLVEETELVQLKAASSKGVEGYVLVPGWNAVYKLKWPIFHSKQKSKAHIPAKWLTLNKKKANKNPLNRWKV